MDEDDVVWSFGELYGAEEEDGVDPTGVHMGKGQTDLGILAEGLGCPALGA